MNLRLITAMFFIVLVSLLVLSVFGLKSIHPTNRSTQNTNSVAVMVNENNLNQVTENTNVFINLNTATFPSMILKYSLPITDFYNRVTKKPFGIYITPQTSPIQPEKFAGYHSGADAETTVTEQNVDIPVYAIMDGTVIFAGHVNGYGGFIAIKFTITGQTMITTYGHVRLSAVTLRVGDSVTSGEKIAILGTGYSSETDGERKHLHFGLIKGAALDYRGYVQSQSELSAWVDPVIWLKGKQATEPD